MSNLLILLTFFPAMIFANNADLNGRTAKYFYFELVPNEKMVLNVEGDKRCTQGTQEQISVTDFESLKTYPSTDSGKNVPVRIKHYYVEFFSPCSTPVQGKILKQITIGPFEEGLTHIRITTSETIRIITE